MLTAAGMGTDAPGVALSGGDTCDVWRFGDRVVKTLRGAPLPGLFAAEAAGLAQLATAGARVPEVLAVSDGGIVVSWLGRGAPDWGALADQVAQIHAHRMAIYGSPTPGFLGRYPLPAATGSWGDVFVHRRLGPLVRATWAALGTLGPRIDRWMRGVALPQEGPCLVHGDLWSGNVHFGVDGPALIDPSAQGAERGLDLAMMRLFGGFPPAFWDAYTAHHPIPPEVGAVVPGYQLIYLVLHLHLFGPAYLPGIAEALDQLGA